MDYDNDGYLPVPNATTGPTAAFTTASSSPSAPPRDAIQDTGGIGPLFLLGIAAFLLVVASVAGWAAMRSRSSE